MRWLCLLALCLPLLPAARADDSPDPGPKIRCTLQNPADKFEALPTPGGLVLRFTSSSGIGRASLAVEAGDLPDRIILQFPGLRGLEFVTFSDGKYKVSGRLYPGARTAFYCDKDGKATSDHKLAALTLIVEEKKDPARIEGRLEIKPGIKLGKEPGVQWIDFYRRK